MRILSGMQPTGKPHLGNYLGAMRQHVEMQDDPKNECFYFLANYHALTTVKDGEKLTKMTQDLAIDYLALGIDPEKTAFFLQSDVPEVTELTWIFNCILHFGMLERAHAWKDALEKGKKDPTVGLFNYPVLMAADILIYQPDLVPVGKDQKQHVEIARDIGQKFNTLYGETFKIPEPSIKKEVETVPGTDGEKMSKSYGNVIEFFEPEDVLKKQVMSIVTDSTPIEEPKDPTKCNVFNIYKLIATDEETAEFKEKYEKGGFGYGDAKKELLNKILTTFEPFRKKRIELEKNLDYIEEVLKKGAEKARETAEETMKIVREKTGL